VLGANLAVEQRIGKAKMNKTVANRDLFIRLTSKSSSGLSGRPWPQLYQHILRNKSFLDASATAVVGEELISIAENAHTFRRYDVVEQTSDLMLALPLSKPFKAAGLYYKQLCVADMGRGDLEKAESLLGTIIESGDYKYRARAFSSLAAIRTARKDYGAAIKLYLSASHTAKTDPSFDPATVVGASRMVAFFKSCEGSHKSALQDLERMLPLARMIGRRNRVLYDDYLNSLAVEMASPGYLEGARRASSVAVASPYAFAYPEWHDTYVDIISRTKRRSVLYIEVWPPGCRSRRVRAKILSMAVRKEQPQQPQTTPSQELGRVIDFPAQAKPKKRKNRMGKPVDRSEIASLSADEKKFICSQILMERSDDKAKLDALYNALPSDLRARALIELVIGTALQDDELTAVLDNLMSDDTPKGEIGRIQSVDDGSDPAAS
jgi:hypothetical protein